jgi:small subunit ribosomal protein S2
LFGRAIRANQVVGEERKGLKIMAEKAQKKPIVAKAKTEKATLSPKKVVIVDKAAKAAASVKAPVAKAEKSMPTTTIRTEVKKAPVTPVAAPAQNFAPRPERNDFNRPRNFSNNYQGNNRQNNQNNYRPANGQMNNQAPQVVEKIVPRAEVKLPELDAFLQAGAHFGHKSSRWNPKMAQYIYDVRGGVHIIDLVKTMKLLKSALKKIQDSSDRGNIMIVGTKGQASSIVNEMALATGALYINKRWPGGLFTNFEVIKKSLDKLMKMEEHIARGAEGFVKKEQILMERDISRLNELYSGIKFMDKLPELLIVIDSRVEKNAITEAKAAGIPIVALLDTNCDPSVIDFPIPANDDSIRSLKLFIGLFTQAITGGRRVEALKALRRDYVARLEKTTNDHKADVERKRAMEESERERIKALRKGESIKAGNVDSIRLVEK